MVWYGAGENTTFEKRPDIIMIMSDDLGYECIGVNGGTSNATPRLDEMPEMRNKGQRIEDAGFDEFCVWHAHQTEEKGELYDMRSDLDEELPIFESQDGPEAAAARAKLKPVFAEMVA